MISHRQRAVMSAVATQQARVLTIARKIARQKVLFIVAAPSSAERVMSMEPAVLRPAVERSMWVWQ